MEPPLKETYYYTRYYINNTIAVQQKQQELLLHEGVLRTDNRVLYNNKNIYMYSICELFGGFGFLKGLGPYTPSIDQTCAPNF